MFLSNTDLMFAKGRLAVCKTFEFYMTLIPKNLSSSAIYYILSSDYPELANRIDLASPGAIHKYLGLVLVKSLRNLNPSYKKIVVLRDPFKRILSAFYSKFVFDAAYSAAIIDPVADYLSKDVGDICFRDFVFYLECHPDEWLDPHFSSQNKFMIFEEYDLYLSIDNNEALQNKLNSIGVHLPRINDVSMRFFPDIMCDYTKINCPLISTQELWEKVEQKSSLPGVGEMMTDEISVYIQDRFADDFDLLKKCLN